MRVCLPLLFVSLTLSHAESRDFIPLASVDSLLVLNNYVTDQPPFEGPARGRILNAEGRWCQFVQVKSKETGPTYFYGPPMTGGANLLAFDDPQCMAAPPDAIGGIAQRLINQQLGTWHRAAYRKTEPKHLKPPGGKGALRQLRGWCLPSTDRPGDSVLVEYVEKQPGFIAYVVHGVGMGCP